MLRMIVMCGSLVLSGSVTAQPEETISANIDYTVSKADMAGLEVAAMEGDPGAALRLTNYFHFHVRNQKLLRRWSIIGAENGSPEAQYRAYQNLASSSSVDDQRRALFWLKQAVTNGYQSAAPIYEICNSLTSRFDNRSKTPCFGPERKNH